ncbi:MAG: hypothetical protein JW876_10860 [Candidatus Krumholzibacteriota bacterium]|nr:hypothetical protein [Candidatus Krumholzibacteriota bacterium]
MRTIAAFAALLAFSVPSYGGDYEGCPSTWGVSCGGLRLSICPAGDFENIGEGCGGNGDFIWVEIYDGEGRPIQGVPVTDYWFGAVDPAEELVLCASPFTADSVTGANGRTTFSGPVAGGGCVATAGLWLSVRGTILLDEPACMTPHIEYITIVSPDLNGDLRVDLSDLAVFGFSYHTNAGEPGYSPCCDFNDDGMIQLMDFAYFGEHYGHAGQ